MQFETTNSLCALCKSAFAMSADAYPGPSRLCFACQQMVRTILPRSVLTRTALTAGRGAAPAMDAVFESGVKQSVYTNDAEDSLAVENSFDYKEETTQVESGFFRLEEESYYKTEHDIQSDSDEIDDFVEDFPGAPHQSLAGENGSKDPVAQSPVAQSPVAQGREAQGEASSFYTEPAPEAWQNVTQIYGARPASDYLAPTTSPLTGAVETNNVETNIRETKIGEMSAVTAQAQGYEEAVTDPWENPLPVWDYSQTEYPVLLGPNKRVQRKKFPLLIPIGLLIALLIAGYFILSQPDLAQDGSQPPVAESSNDSDSPAAGNNSTGIEPGQQNVLTQASADTTPEQASTPAASTEFGTYGSLTLQSAAFPDEAGASEFSLKLIRAGIPAYVVPADLPRKGRWFRVRVGRFANNDDAKRYAAQSRLRAKAAGMDLDFIVVEYGKP